MKIYLMNGPPRSGKDTAGQLLARMLDNSTVLKFAEPLKMATHAAMAMLTGGPNLKFCEGYDDCKDIPSPDFMGLTPRAAYIAMSEQYIKPLLGKQFFGLHLAERIKKLQEQGTEHVIITDSGFYEELEPLINEFGADACIIVQLLRLDSHFEGDSRGWLESEGVRTELIGNDDDIASLRVSVAELIGKLEKEVVQL